VFLRFRLRYLASLNGFIASLMSFMSLSVKSDLASSYAGFKVECFSKTSRRTASSGSVQLVAMIELSSGEEA
jgi:hypothetical protein